MYIRYCIYFINITCICMFTCISAGPVVLKSVPGALFSAKQIFDRKLMLAGCKIQKSWMAFLK